ncbi:MAG: hypothetical protein WBA66_10185 [Xanthobacteraceae bacterium]
MDTLHSMLRAIRPARESFETKSVPTHLVVFREFLAHLERLQRKAPVRPLRRKTPIRRKPVKR